MSSHSRLALAAAMLLFGCGDNLWPQGGRLSPADQLIIVAHPDDDLIFMQPDLTLALARGESVTAVYVTAGDAGRDLDYVRRRQRGMRYAYGDAAATEAWDCYEARIAGHTPEVCRTVGGYAQVTLVFLGWPDGGPEGNAARSLRGLWEGRIDDARSIAARPQAYSQDSLLRVLTALVEKTQPRHIATLDVLPSHGDDHSDHSLVGVAATIAAARARSAAPILAYRGYNIANEPVSKGPELYEASSRMMRAYSACTISCGECEVAPCDTLDPYEEGLTLRRYATSIRQRDVTARLATDGGCLARSGDALVVGDCATATEWELVNSQLRDRANPSLCVTVDSSDHTGRLVFAPCDQGADQWWRLSDDGFLLSGSVAPPQVDMRTRHTLCLAADRAVVRARTCGDTFGSRWQLLQRWQAVGPVHSEPTALADIDGDGRADLCRAGTSGITCKRGRGDAEFEADAVWLPVDAQLAHTLAIGTVGNIPTACWLTPTNLQCRSSGTAWSIDVTATSLALLDADSDGEVDVCIDTEDDHRCYRADGTALVALVRVLPTGRITNLNNRGGPDVCGESNGQLTCILNGAATWLSAPTPWSYIDQGRITWPGSLPAPRWTDLDGDGVLDAITADHGNLVMAYNNFYGLGPAFSVATPTSAIHSLILGDIDGDGTDEACVEGQAALYCQVPHMSRPIANQRPSPEQVTGATGSAF